MNGPPSSRIASLPSKRGGDNFVFEQNYTGQRLDDSGLIYYNARYYDPKLGQFISPDTIIPDPNDYFSYNRYLYGRGNPVSNNDPTGHCATTSNGSPDGNDGQCWALANTISQQWDTWNYNDYWSNRYTSKEVFSQYIATTSANDTAFFQREFELWYTSDDFKNMPGATPWPDQGSLDMGDYWTVTFGTDWVGSVSITRDDWGNWYWGYGLGPSLGEYPSVARGDIFIAPNDALPSFSGLTDIDKLPISEAEKSKLAREVLSGASANMSGGYWLGLGVSMSVASPYHVTVEGNFTWKGSASVSPWSRNWVAPWSR